MLLYMTILVLHHMHLMTHLSPLSISSSLSLPLSLSLSDFYLSVHALPFSLSPMSSDLFPFLHDAIRHDTKLPDNYSLNADG